MRTPAILALSALVLGLSGCGTAMANLKRRASFEFNCPEAQVQVTELGAGAFGVDGCGRRAIYVKVGKGLNSEWVLNSDATPAPQ